MKAHFLFLNGKGGEIIWGLPVELEALPKAGDFVRIDEYDYPVVDIVWSFVRGVHPCIEVDCSDLSENKRQEFIQSIKEECS